MTHAFLIARQEFVKYVTRRGFAISILMFPLWIMIVIFVPQWTGGGANGPKQQVFTIVDRAGGYRGAVLEALARENAQNDLLGLAHYTQGMIDLAALGRAKPHLAAILRAPQGPDSLAQYRALGGWRVALPLLTPYLNPNAKPFRVSQPRFVYVDPPDDLARAAPEHFAATLRPYFRDGAYDHISAAIVIPQGFGAPGRITAYYFARDPADTDLRDFAAGALSRALQQGALTRLAPDVPAGDVLDTEAALESRDTAPPGGGGDAEAMQSVVPIALAIILFVISVMNASVLLQGVVEEKSTRMIEVLLSCATAREITTGKLIGVIAVALTTLVIWALVLFALMALASQGTVSLVFAALGATASLQTLPLLIVFFLCGLLIYGSLFLAIGSMANSLADAQSLLGPSMLILMLPNLMIAGVMHDPNGTLASTLTWVPIYTPFFMMLRIASHPPAVQLWGALALAVGTAAFLIWWTGRVFARHVLTTERPPTLSLLLRGLLRRGWLDFARHRPKSGDTA